LTRQYFIFTVYKYFTDATYIQKRRSFSLTPRPSLEKRHIEIWLAFSIPKTSFLFVY
jgi:hypothetical protein